MKVAISNIAWPAAEEPQAAAVLVAKGVQGLEVAPTAVWSSPTEEPMEAVRAYRDGWRARGVRIVACQSLLFGRPDLCLFTTDAARRQTLAYLSAIIQLAGALGAEALVFGSPKNRQVRDTPPAVAWSLAVEFFRTLGDVAARHQTCLCIEPNPPAYGCDFIRTAAEGRELVRQVDHPGFRLHLDAAALTLSGEDGARAIEESFPWLRHFHASEPQLGVVGSGVTDHARFADRLRRLGYQHWVSVEMRSGWTQPSVRAVESALQFALDAYH